MKTARPGRSAVAAPAAAAFTLVELMVVISIIIILAGLLFPAISSVTERAKKLQAANDEQNIVNAVKHYGTEYGKLPLATSQSDISTNVNAGKDVVYGKTATSEPTNESLVNVLLGKPHNDEGKYAAGATTYPYNPRQVVFCEAKLVKDANSPKNGLGTKAGQENRWYDPWGQPYCVWLDANYNNVIDEFFGVYTTDAKNPLPPVPVAVASFGKDLAPGKKTGGTAANPTGDGKYNGSDDVVSWR